jgi:hypothetical protein
MLRIFVLLFAVLLAAFGVRAFGSYQWQRDTLSATSGLECCAVANPLTYNPAAELAGLPRTVQKYFERVLRPGQVMIRRVHHVQDGHFDRDGHGSWARLHAVQDSVVNSPGFVWDARIVMIPGLLDTQVRDSYSAGSARMSAKVLGLVTMMEAQNAPELAQAALQRHLGEAVWFPTALLPSQGVVWSELGQNQARATLTDHGIQASLDFHFNQAGDITGMSTAERFQFRDGKYVATPWQSTCGEYAERGGMRIPLQAEVAWIENGKRIPYWRGTIVSIEYE